jgi:peptidyl-prolyl cis-trans isomerase B (cyclophilin B)
MGRNYLLGIFICLFFIQLNSQSSYTFSGKPQYDILARRNGTVIGTIRVELFPKIALRHVINFDSLVSFQFYDTTAFHRVIPGFMIQGGDPNSRHGPTNTWGYGDPSQPTVPAEFSQLSHKRGIMSAARKGNDINSATSQFFICVANYPSLDGNYSIHGRVVSGMSVADTIVAAPRNPSNNMPYQKIEMFVTRVGSNDSLPQVPQLITPKQDSSEVDVTKVLQLKWQPVPGALLYYAEVADDSLFTQVVKTATLLTPQFNVGGINALSRYYWRVKANNGGNFSSSETRVFHTEGYFTGVNEHRVSAVRVHPNPGQGIFLFSGLQPGELIRISDLSGRILGETEAQEATLTVDLSGYAPGVYFYSVGSEVTKTGKLLIR